MLRVQRMQKAVQHSPKRSRPQDNFIINHWCGYGKYLSQAASLMKRNVIDFCCVMNFPMHFSVSIVNCIIMNVIWFIALRKSQLFTWFIFKLRSLNVSLIAVKRHCPDISSRWSSPMNVEIMFNRLSLIEHKSQCFAKISSKHSICVCVDQGERASLSESPAGRSNKHQARGLMNAFGPPRVQISFIFDKARKVPIEASAESRRIGLSGCEKTRVDCAPSMENAFQHTEADESRLKSAFHYIFTKHQP